MDNDIAPAARIIGYCLNCGDKAYEIEGRHARHAGTHKIACPMGNGACAALRDE